eukprot:CAMPEP_0194503866 /NCGR_PEP_ID=MMETSP0253-20130528/28621_1 /TAXON_ID=2966 /ORGANISM="Noctiluca scintillans" /LENGTH=110 /DNA_ID=CAMNT_0039346191 /DNA_START=52 /DNA_END=381 /DNA_ORIENTATION=-
MTHLCQVKLDGLIGKMSRSVAKLDAASGSVVKFMQAEVDTLAVTDHVAMLMMDFVGDRKDTQRLQLQEVFGGDCTRIAMARELAETIIGPPPKLSEKGQKDPRPEACLKA